LAILAGCAGQPIHRSAGLADSEANYGGRSATDMASGGRPAPQRRDEVPAPSSESRKIVYNGGLTVQVADLEAAERETRRIVEETKGWVHRSERSSFTLRVPAALFQPTMDRLAALGRVVDRRTAATDVTEEYRDIDLRLSNAEQLRARLAALLEKAKDVKETLEVERELARVVEEIERLKGRKRAMTDQIEHSTIMVAFVQVRPEGTSTEMHFPFPWIRQVGLHVLKGFGR
jgi:uncharacterized protein DUF4349